MTTGQIGAWLVPVWGWKAIFLLGGIPGLLIALLVARLPESPRWLISKGRFREAEKIVEQMETSTNRRVQAAASSIPAPARGQAQRGGWREILSAFFLGGTPLRWVFCAC